MYLVCTNEKAQHGTAAAPQKKKNETENFGRKKNIPVPSHVIIVCPWNTLHHSKKKKK